MSMGRGTDRGRSERASRARKTEEGVSSLFKPPGNLRATTLSLSANETLMKPSESSDGRSAQREFEEHSDLAVAVTHEHLRSA